MSSIYREGNFDAVIDYKGDRQTFKNDLTKLSQSARRAVMLRYLDEETIDWLGSEQGIAHLKDISADRIRLHWKTDGGGIPIMAMYQFSQKYDHTVPGAPFKACHKAGLIELWASEGVAIKLK